MYIYIYTSICIYTYAYIHGIFCMYVCTYVRTYAKVRRYIITYIRCIYGYMNINLCMYTGFLQESLCLWGSRSYPSTRCFYEGILQWAKGAQKT